MAVYECNKCGERKRHSSFWGKRHDVGCTPPGVPGIFCIAQPRGRAGTRKRQAQAITREAKKATP